MARKTVKPDDVDRIVTPIVEALGTIQKEVGSLREEVGGLREDLGGLREELGGLREDMNDGFAAVNARLQRVETNTADTASAVRHLERGATGVGRTVALEERVRRIEEHVGLESK